MKKKSFETNSPAQFAASMREQAMARAQKRKEEFLGARVPKELRDKVTQRAEQEGLPVSLLIRRILEEFVGQPGQSVVKASEPRASVLVNSVATITQRFAHVLAWDKITLHREVTCVNCGVVLKAGSSAALGVTGNAGNPLIICERCRESI